MNAKMTNNKRKSVKGTDTVVVKFPSADIYEDGDNIVISGKAAKNLRKDIARLAKKYDLQLSVSDGVEGILFTGVGILSLPKVCTPNDKPAKKAKTVKPAQESPKVIDLMKPCKKKSCKKAKCTCSRKK